MHPGEYHESLVVPHDLKIRAVSMDRDTVIVVGDGTQPVLTVKAEASVEVIRLHLTEGGGAAGVVNHGSLTVKKCTLTQSEGEFGGIMNQGTLVLTNRTVVQSNVGTGFFGGGLTNLTGTVTVSGSSHIRDNTGRMGGGVCNMMGQADLSGAILSSNHATASGGAFGNMQIGGTVIPPTSLPRGNTTDGMCAQYFDSNASPACVD